ncbi:MAG TPA: choice-of-anchor tandem repeat NxxGxxAF-containing protein, partial [bacterium]|nr:choice-of-anchor tandem repeat NxxGxxAF-containing protein [bacterium]
MKKLFSAVALMAFAAPLPVFASGDFFLEKVMVVGDAAPGTEAGTSYAPFPFEYVPMVPTIDEEGRVGFASRLQGPAINATNAVGNWAGAPGSVELAARAGNAAPGVPSGIYRSFPEDFDLFAPLVGNGLTGVRATLSGGGINFGNDSGIWIGPGGTLSLIGREGSPAPGLPAGLTIADTFSLTKMNSEGRSMVTGMVAGAGVTSANDEVFWSDRTGSWLPILREGDQAPGLASGVVFGGAGQYIGTGYSFESSAFNNDGDFAAQANLTGPGIDTFNNEALWVEHNGQLKLLAREGAHAPGMPPNVVFGSGVLADFGDISFNALEQAAFTVRLGDGSATYALFSDHTGALGPFALPGTPAPGTAEDFGIVGYQTLSDAGRLAFRATLSN